MRKRIILMYFIFLLAVPLHAKDPITAKVERVIDGDTIELESGEKVRLIGIDCPEMKNKKRNKRNAKKLGVDPDRYESYAGEARSLLTRLLFMPGEFLTGNPSAGRLSDVTLQFDPSNEKIGHKDKYNRWLAYVIATEVASEMHGRDLKQGEDGEYLMNRRLVEKGYCPVYRRFNFSKKDEFIELEKEAKEKGRGIWEE